MSKFYKFTKNGDCYDIHRKRDNVYVGYLFKTYKGKWMVSPCCTSEGDHFTYGKIFLSEALAKILQLEGE